MDHLFLSRILDITGIYYIYINCTAKSTRIYSSTGGVERYSPPLSDTLGEKQNKPSFVVIIL
jgi:hypothetical protein